MRLLDEADDLKLLRCGEFSCLVSPIPDHAFFEQPLFVLSHLAHHFAPSNGDGARLNGTNARRARNLQDDKILLDHPQFVQSRLWRALGSAG